RVTEDAPQLAALTRRTLTNAYSVSKALSEQLAWRLAAQRGLELTAVRPCAIYGAFDPNFTAVFRRLAGLPVTVMPALMHLPLVYAGDVAEAIARALERPVSIGRAYNVTGDDATVCEFARAWREAGGRGALGQLRLPAPWTRADEADRRGDGGARHPRVRGREGVLEGDVGIRLARVERVAGDPVGGRPRGGDGQQGGHGGCGGWARRAHAAAVPAWPAGPSPTGPGRSIASARYAPVTSHAAR